MLSKSRILLSIFIVLASWTMAFSAIVDSETAKQVAQSMVANHVANHGNWGTGTQPSISNSEPVYYNGEKIAYNFTVQPSGQLLIAGSDLLSPVLLYSTSSNFTPDLAKTQGSLESWIIPEIYNIFVELEGQTQGMKSVDIRGYSNSKVANAWKVLASGLTSKTRMLNKFAAAGPVLTTTWSQSPYYNRYCPTLSGELTIVGCVATAWSQLLNYWEWPDQGEGSQTYYWENGGKRLSETFDTVYDWDNMPDQLDGQSSNTQINAVAKLCYDVGIAAEMNYGVDGSGSNAYAHEYLPRFFKYKDTAEYHDRSNYTSTEWMELIKPEFDASTPRPVAFSIFDNYGGHEVIIDGYQEGLTDKVHINFGWDGSYNGYYDITQNFQASYNWLGDYQQIVIKIEPDKQESDSPWDNLPNHFYTFIKLTDESVELTLPSQCYAYVFGSSGNNAITIASGAKAVLSNFVGNNTVSFEESSTDFTVFRSRAKVYLTGLTNETLVKIAASTTSQTITFSDGSLPLVISEGNVLLGSQIVTLTESAVAGPTD